MSGRYRHHKYNWSKPFGTVRHWWELVGPHGAVHFHANEDNGYGASAGLEFHHLSGDGAPHHVNCPLTGGRCWHDGTSLYAMDHLWPLVEPHLREGNHESIFAILEREADKHWREQPESE